jgi:spore germination cell wall hydrolase CwlJ-like protein
VVAALLAGLVFAGPTTAEVPAAAHDVAGELSRIMGREQAAMTALGASRIRKIADTRAGTPVTVTTRDALASAPAVATADAPLDFAALDAMPTATGDAEWQCLAAAIYFESRGEPIAGQIGVAEVVLNRVESRAYPNTICGVTTQGAGSGRGCQFSYACDGRSDTMTSAVPRARAEKLARVFIDGRPRTVTDGATHFHATYVRPDWSRRFARTAVIGNHIFYRQPTQVAQN